MATCPNCRVRGYPGDGTFTVKEVLTVTSGLLGGSTLKVPARRRLSLTCSRCAWSTYGTVDGRYFVADAGGG